MPALTRSPTERNAASARVGAREQAARLPIARDHGAVAEGVDASGGRVLNWMAGCAQPRAHVRSHARLEVHGAIVEAAPRKATQPPRPVDGGLHVGAEVEDVHEHLQIGLRLPAPPGRRPGYDEPTIREDEIRVQRVQRPPSGSETVRVVAADAHVRETIVEERPGARDELARAPLVEE